MTGLYLPPSAGTPRTAFSLGCGGASVTVFVLADYSKGYTEVDGRESDYVMDIDAVTNLGHAGRFVKTETGYVFFELTGLPDNPVPGGKIQDDPEKTGGIIPSNGPLLYPRPSLAGSSGKEDGAILSVSMSLGENLTVYDVFGNNCGTAARDALTTPKSGLNYNIYPGGPFSMVHTAIGSLLELLRVA